MENLNLGSDESVIHTTQRLIISGVGYDAVLTASRLILVATDSGRPQIDIPYSGIELAAAKTNHLREPIIQVTFTTSDGSARGIELIFIFLAAGRNIQNRDKCISVMERLGVPVEHDPTPADFYSRNKRDRMDAGTLEVDKPAGRPAVPEWTIYGPSQSSRNPLPEEPRPTSPLFTIIATILIAAIIIGAMIVPIPAPGKSNPGSPQVAAGASASQTPAPAQVPEPVTTPQPTATPVPEVVLRPGEVPANGIWVKISYPGNYAGFLAAGGWRLEVNSSGTQIYQLPVQDIVINGFIEKGDGSGDSLEMGIYNGGTLVESRRTTSPRGVVEMHVPVGPAIVNIPVPTVSSRADVVTAVPTQSSRYVIPATGVWVHVLYPGDYSGFLNSNGQLKTVNSTGEQFFQIPITSGVIDGSIEKSDGSVNNLAVEVYKDGTLLDLANTSAPKGSVEIHTNV